MAYPALVSRDEWLVARKKLLVMEKEFTRHRDALNAERRRLPMVGVDKAYVFEGPKDPPGCSISSRGVSSSSSTTSCSIRAGMRAARAARSSSTTSAISPISTHGRPRSSSSPGRH
jgi:hypothetical protein